MKNQYFILLTTALLVLLFTEYSYSQSSVSYGYYDLNGCAISGNGNSSIVLKSAIDGQSQLVFIDKTDTYYGSVFGQLDGDNFGFLDGDRNWSILVAKDNYTAFRINDSEMMRITADGHVGIGTINPEHELEVCGKIRAKEILVEETWCDYVFEPEYCLTTLEEEAEFIKLYGHLSNFESAKAMDGMINVNDIFKRQQVQIEENLLHLIELNDENEALQIEVDELKEGYALVLKELAELKAQLK